MEQYLLSEFTVSFLSAVPLVEPRVAIPFGVATFHLSPLMATIFAFLGGIIPAIFITPLVFRFGEVMRARIPAFENVLMKTQARHSVKFEEGKLLALFILVTLPLPMSGVWTGILVSYLFGVPLRLAIPILILGTLIGSIGVGLLVAAASGVISFI